jgi:uncharacterized membrane protein
MRERRSLCASRPGPDDTATLTSALRAARCVTLAEGVNIEEMSTMPMKLQEVHPALVHFPLTLLPLSIGADLLGRVTGSETLLDLGRRTMPLAVASGVVAGAAGLMAQTEVEADGEALAMLQTHRTLNLGLVAIAGAMAAYRAGKKRPSAAYLGVGLAGLAALTYSAYLGGAMVYHEGVGVEAAGGVRKDPSVPELSRRDAPRALQTAASDVAKGIRLTVEESAKGDLVPALTERGAHHRDTQAGAS